MKTVKLSNPETSKLLVDYRDDNVVLLDNIHQVEHAKETIRAEFFMLVLVEQGQCNAIINGEKIFLEGGDLLICTPGNFFKHGMVSINFQCRICLSSPTYTHDLLKDSRLSSLQYVVKKSSITMRLSLREQNILKNYYNLITSYDTFRNESMRGLCVQKLLQAFAFAITAFLVEHGSIQEGATCNAADNTFRAFLRILHEHPDGRSVRFYAEKLNISPKYFNTICKQITGKTASTIINEELVSQAKIMLKDPDLSIKQIAATLGFSNQSHFGTFMRRETGVSPQNMRKNNPLGQ